MENHKNWLTYNCYSQFVLVFNQYQDYAMKCLTMRRNVLLELIETQVKKEFLFSEIILLQENYFTISDIA